MRGADKTGSASGRAPPAIALRGVSKSFGTIRANRDIGLTVEAGTIHGIVGENGAGKSTLMNILYGLHQADSGEISIGGDAAQIRSSADAISHGIGMVHQHFMLVPNFTVLENVMLGTEGGPLLAEGRERTLATLDHLANDYGMTVDPHALAGDLPVGLQQRVEIIKALKGGARILILDEPTGVLTPQEAESLFRILDTLREDGVTILLITHKLEEIMAAADNVSIMRQGQMVGHRETVKTNPEELAELMVGRKVLLRVDRGTSNPGNVRLSVKQLGCISSSGIQLLDDISFEVRSGEILGIAGIAGNGQSELLEVLSGMLAPDWGTIHVMGHEISPSTPTDPDEMRSHSIAHIPEDRHRHGLVLGFTARENAILGHHHGDATGTNLLIDSSTVTAQCERLMKEHDVRPANPDLRARSFSGGNQQKLVIARELDTRPNILIVGQPTRGVDIGAIEFIHKELIALRDEGAAIVLVSVELEEVLGLSDRIMAMNAGKLVGIIDRADADEQTLGLMMAGIGPADQAA